MFFDTLSSRTHLLKSIVISAFLITLILIFLPPEKTLGPVIKLVYLHAALVQTSLLLFVTAGVTGFLDLFLNRKRLYAWSMVSQKMAIITWVFYLLSSMIVTYLSWGVAIAWEEPRVQMSIRVFILSLVFFIVSVWLNNRKIGDIINIITAVLVVLLSLTAVNIRHPNNPVGESESVLYAIAFYFVLVLTMIFTLQLMRLIFKNTLEQKE
ncbi:MAG: hypothetical protein KDF60_06135 [Calditrichaeota bacterium]|nr:hypothetical protein [Calditrichota bacterium]